MDLDHTKGHRLRLARLLQTEQIVLVNFYKSWPTWLVIKPRHAVESKKF